MLPAKCLLSVEITDACPLSCRHCFRRGMNRPRHVPPSSVKSRVGLAPSEAVTLTGGEPLAHPRLRELIESIGKPTAISTSGALLAERAEALAEVEAPILVVCSLDFPDERQDELRGFPGLFERIREGLRTLVGLGIECRILVCEFGENMNERDIEALIGFSSENCWTRTGENISFQRYFPQPGGPSPPSPSQLGEAFGLIERYGEEHGVRPRVLDVLYRRSRHGCARRRFCDTDGRWSICPFFPKRFGSPSLPRSVAELLAILPRGCERCEFSESCSGGCPAYRLLHGSIYEPDPMCDLRPS